MKRISNILKSALRVAFCASLITGIYLPIQNSEFRILNSVSAQDAERTALNGDEMYRQGDYAGAVASYEEAIATGMTSADLHYNLGNAYYRTGDMAHAILNYERALRLKPSMHDARENLELASSHTQDNIDVMPRLFFVKIYDNLCTHILPATWRIIWLILLALVIAAAVIVIVGHGLTLRRWALGGGVVAALLLVFATFTLISSTNHFNRHNDAVVMQQALSVKSSPEIQSADKFIIHEGTRVHIAENLSGWYKITIADGTSGWCQAEAVERI